MKHKKQINRAIIYFFVFGFLGWIVDSAFSSLIFQEIIFGGFFKTLQLPIPLAPIYGFGAVILFYSKPWLKKFHQVWQFVVIGLLLTAFEYIGGVFCLLVFQRRIWDYSNNYMNLHGHIDLFHAVSWAALGFVFLKYIQPRFDKLFDL